MSKPKKVGPWWRNTYFLFGAILLLIGLIGLVRGAQKISDPGQPPATQWLPWLYILAAAVFVLNGFMSHNLHANDLKEEETKNA
ncbi:MAG: hypothetical protein U0R49_06010 [Fimbriimonadales bacterium]